MSPFLAENYREGLRQILSQRKAADRTLTFRRVAALAGVQNTYFSNVLKERAHFSIDQLHEICRALDLSEAQAEFLATLLEWERSQSPDRRRRLMERVQRIRHEHVQTQAHLKATPSQVKEMDAALYYLDPMVQVVHVHLTLAKYAKSPSLLVAKLNLTPQQLQKTLDFLESLGYVEANGGAYKVLVQNRHLPPESPICSPHQILLRGLSAQQLQRVREQNRYSFSVTFTGQESILTKLRGEFMSFVERAEALVREGEKLPDQEVYQINFDLFPWAV